MIRRLMSKASCLLPLLNSGNNNDSAVSGVKRQSEAIHAGSDFRVAVRNITDNAILPKH